MIKKVARNDVRKSRHARVRNKISVKALADAARSNGLKF